MEAQAALVGADRAVHLDAEAAVDLDVAAVVLPRHAEHHDALGLDDALEDARAAQIGTARQHEIDALEDLLDGLMELGFGGVPGLYRGQHFLDVGGEINTWVRPSDTHRHSFRAGRAVITGTRTQP